MPRAKNEWRQEPDPVSPLYHLKWTHGVWVSSALKAHQIDHIHQQLHGPKPEGWTDPDNTWAPDHTHYRPDPVPLVTEDTEENWQW